MTYLKAPMLSTSFSPQGKRVQRRLENLMENKNRKRGWLLPMTALCLLMLGSLVACAPATATICLPEAAPAEPQPVQEEPVYYASPLAGETTILAPYGTRVHPVFGTEAMHSGVDLSAEEGSPVLAAAGGVVLEAGYTNVYGNCVTLTHANGQESFYGHLKQLSVEAGMEIASGTELGLVGSTGLATGPHLHFEIRENGVALDPTDVVS